MDKPKNWALAPLALGLLLLSGAGFENPAARDADVRALAQADLALALWAGGGDPAERDTVRFTLVLENRGTDAAAGIAVGDTLPSGLAFAGASANQGNYDNATGVWSVGALAAGSSVVCTLRAVAASGTAGSTLLNRATASAQGPPDPDPSNNTRAVSVHVRTFRVASGSYTGTGAVRSLSGLGFRPDVVLIKQDGFTAAEFATSAMPAGTSKPLTSATALRIGVITSLDAQGFTLSNHASVNSAGGTYYWTAFQAAPGTMVVGSYLGDGSADRLIDTGLPPAYVLVANAGTRSPLQRFADQAASMSLEFRSGAEVAGAILGLTSSGFRVGNPVAVNETGAKHYYVAWKSLSGQCAAGSYVGDAVNNRSVLTPGFKPQLVLIRRQTTGTANIHRSELMTGDFTLGLDSGFSFTNGIKSLLASGFQLGLETRVNELGTIFYHVAFHDDPSAHLPTDLRLLATVANPIPTVGDTVVFTISLGNLGPAATTHIFVSDPLPPGLLFVSATPSQGSYSEISGLWTAGSVTALAGATLILRARVEAVVAGTLVADEAKILSADAADPVAGNNAASASVFVRAADILVRGAADKAVAAPGDTVRFLVTVRNLSPRPALALAVTDSLPTDFSYLISAATQGSFAPGSGIWSAGNLAAGDSARLIVAATVDLGAPPGPVFNRVRLTGAGQFDPVDENNEDSVLVLVRNTALKADLVLAKSVNPLQASSGDTVSFLVRLRNAGPDTATAVAVADTLPAGLTFLSHGTSQGAYVPGSGAWTVGTLAPGDSASLGIRARVEVGAIGRRLTNTARIIALAQADTVAANDAAQASVAVPGADLAVSKTADRAAADVGDAVTFTVELRNVGPDPADFIRVADLLPPGLSLMAAGESQGTYSPNPGRWIVGTLAAGDTARLTLTARVEAGTQGTSLPNTAAVIASSVEDPDSANNAGSAAVYVRSADLTVGKTVSDIRAAEGDTVSFRVTVRNLGPDAAAGIEIGDSLPSELSYLAHLATAGSFDPGTGHWTVGTLAVGDSAVLGVTTRVRAGAQGSTVTNTALVTRVTTADPDTADTIASASFHVPSADVAVAKSVSRPSPVEGDTVSFTVTVQNLGPDGATGLQVSDALPALLLQVSHAPDQGSYDPGTGRWTVGDIAAGALSRLRLVARVAPGAQGRTLTNVARVTAAGEDDPGPGNEADSASVTVPTDALRADLGLRADVSNPIPAELDTIFLGATVRNLGPDNATGISIAVPFPSEVTFQRAFASRGSYSLGPGVWTVGSLAAGDSATLALRVQVSPYTSGHVFHHRAAVAAVDQADLVSANNADSVLVTVLGADLRVTKTVSTLLPGVGDTVLYRVVVHNQGPDEAQTTWIYDQLPPEVEHLFTILSQGVYSTLDHIWHLGALAPGDSAIMQLRTRVRAGTEGRTVVNTAAVINQVPGDPDTTDNEAGVTLHVRGTDLALDKTANRTETVNGDTVTYTVTLANLGTLPAGSIQVRDVLPPVLVFLSATPAQGGYNPGTGVWSVGSLGAATSATLRLDARVVSSLPGSSITNTAQITASDSPDPVPGNNTASVVVTVPSADLALTKIADTPSAHQGETVTFTVGLRNLGPDGATAIRVTDLLPAGLRYSSHTVSSGSFAPGTGLWSVASLASGATITLTVAVVVQPGTPGSTLVNQAAVTSARAGDPVPANNSASVSVQVPSADVSVEKTADRVRASAGDPVAFTVHIWNAGPDPATGLRLGDPLPGGFTYVSHSAGQGTYDSGTGLWTIGTVPSGGVATLGISARIAPGMIGTILTNTATLLKSTEDDPDSLDRKAAVSIVVPGADLQLDASVDRPVVDVGDTVTFTVALANAGPDPATGTMVHDGLPAGLTYLTHAPSQGAYSNATMAWTVGTVGPGTTATLILSATVDSGTGGRSLQNLAFVSATDVQDPVAGNNRDSVAVRVRSADLEVKKTASRTAAGEGDTVSFQVTVKNLGPDPAGGVEILDALPPGLDHVRSTPDRGSYSPVSGRWTLGSMASGFEARLTVDARVGAGTQGRDLVNTARVAVVETEDPAPGNNAASVSVHVPSSDLALGKTASVASSAEGDSVTFTVTLKNQGPDPATGARVTDLLPTGFGLLRAVPDRGTYAPGTGQWTVGPLASGAQAQLLLLVRIVSGVQGRRLTNVARITARTEDDPVGANDADSASVVVPSADLVVTKSVNNRTPLEGDTLLYTVSVRNQGPDPAHDIRVAENLQAGLILLGGTPDQGSFDPGSRSWTVTTLAPGAGATLRVQARVGAGTLGSTLTNQATITAAREDDPDPASNTARVAVRIASADLQVSKAADRVVAGEGDTLLYRVHVSNAGPDTATGVVLSDVIPDGLTPLTAAPSQGVYAPANGRWTVGALAVGDSAVLFIGARVAAGTTGQDLVNTARVSGRDQMDPDPGNDTGTATVSIEAADLDLVKTAFPTSLEVGDTVRYRIAVRNFGPHPAGGVVVRDALHPDVHLVSTVPSAGTYDQETGLWSVGSVAAGDSAVLILAARVARGHPGGAMPNTAAVIASDRRDPRLGNNTASASVRVASADIALDVADLPASVVPGQTVTVALTAHNAGPDTATAFSVGLPLPRGLDYVSAAASTGTYDPGPGVWTVGRLAPSAAATLEVSVRVGTVPDGTALTVQASVLDLHQGDPSAANDTARVGMDVQFEISLASGPAAGGTMLPGDPRREMWRVEITNANFLPDTLTSLTLAGLTVGPGSQAERDAEWTALRVGRQGGSPLDFVPFGEGAMAQGKVVFLHLIVPLPARETVALIVEGAPSLVARDGDHLDLSLLAASDIGFREARPVASAWPLNPPGSFLVDGMSRAQIAVADAGSGYLLSGARRRHVWTIRVPANGYASDVLQRFDVENRGTARPGAEIEAMELWADLDGDDRLDTFRDRHLGELRMTGTRYEITGLSLTVPTGGLALFITVDVAAGALAGLTLDLALPSGPDVALGMLSDNDGPLDGPVTASLAQTVTQADRVTMASLPLPPGAVQPGEKAQAVLHLVATNTYASTRTLKRLVVTNASRTIHGGSPADLDRMTDRVTLVLDANENAAFDPGTDPVLAAGAFAQGRAEFPALSVPLPPGDPVYFLVTADVALGTAADGDSLAATLASALDAGFAENLSLADGRWPLSGRSLAVDGCVAAQVTLYPVPPTTLGPNEGPEPALVFTVPPNGYVPDRLQGLRVGFSGSADPTQDFSLGLYEDDGDGTFEPGQDAPRGPLTWTGAFFSSLALDVPVPAAGTRLYVTLSTPGSAPDSATVRLSVPIDGLIMRSGNDGPLDAPVVNPSAFTLSSAPLLATLGWNREASVPGQAVTLTLSVTNTTTETIDDVTPTPLRLTGSSLGALLGPAPALLSLAPGESGVFNWQCTAQTPGPAGASVYVTGRGAVSGLSLRSLTAFSPDHRVFAPVTEVLLTAKEAMPPVVILGQENLAPFTFTFENANGVGAADVLLPSIRIEVQNAQGARLAPDQVLSRVQLLEGQHAYFDSDQVPSSGPLVLNLSPPARITPQEPVSLSFRVDVRGDSPVSAFRLAVVDAAALTAQNALSGQPVPVRLPSQSYPIVTAVATLVVPAQSLALASLAQGPVRAEPALTDVPVFSLELENQIGSSLPSEVRLLSVAFSLADGSGAPVTAPGSVLRALTVRSALGPELAALTLESGHPDSMVLVFSPPLSLPANAPTTLAVVAALADHAPIGTYRLLIANPTCVSALDPNSYRSVPAALAESPLRGSSLAILAAPTALRAIGRPELPPHTTLGSRGLLALSGTLRHPDPGATAAITVSSFVFSAWDQSRTGLAPGTFLDRLALIVDNVEVAALSSFPSSAGAFSLPVSGLTLDPTTSAAFEIRVDFEADAPAGTFEIAMVAPALVARDAVSGADVPVAAEAGSSLPFVSGLTQLTAIPREATVRLLSLLPPMVSTDPETVAAVSLILTNPAPEGTGPVVVTELHVIASDLDRAPIALGRGVARVVVLEGGTVRGASRALTADSTSARVLLDSPLQVGAEKSVTLTLAIIPQEAPEVAGFRLGLPDQSLGVDIPGFGVRPEAGSFPLWTEHASFATHDLESSFSNFPNPFAAGRQATTFSFYLPRPADVTLRILTPRGETVLTLLGGTPQAEGLHQALTWDGKNGEGLVVRNGVYVAELEAAFTDGSRARILRKVAVLR